VCSSDLGDDLKCLFGLVAIAGFPRERVEPQERDGCHGVAGGCRRILKWLAPCAQNAQRLSLAVERRVAKSTAGIVKKVSNHEVGNLPGEVKVCEVGSSLIGVETCDGHECI